MLVAISESTGKKTWAIKYTPVYDLLPEPLKNHLNGVGKKECGRIFKIIAELTRTNSFEKTITAVTNTLERGVIDTDSIVATFNRLNAPELKLPQLNLSQEIPELPSVSFASGIYDNFMKAGE